MVENPEKSIKIIIGRTYVHIPVDNVDNVDLKKRVFKG